MLKFLGYIENHPLNDSPDRPNNSTRIPQVYEVDDTLSFMYADTVLQILRGDGIYRGYEKENSAENLLPNSRKKARKCQK